MNGNKVIGMLPDTQILTEWRRVSVSEVSRHMSKHIIGILSTIESGNFQYCGAVWPDGVAALVHWKGADGDDPPPSALLRAYRDPLSIEQDQ